MNVSTSNWSSTAQHSDHDQDQVSDELPLQLVQVRPCSHTDWQTFCGRGEPGEDGASEVCTVSSRVGPAGTDSSWATVYCCVTCAAAVRPCAEHIRRYQDD